jgi:hypothetical protein
MEQSGADDLVLDRRLRQNLLTGFLDISIVSRCDRVSGIQEGLGSIEIFPCNEDARAIPIQTLEELFRRVGNGPGNRRRESAVRDKWNQCH